MRDSNQVIEECEQEPIVGQGDIIFDAEGNITRKGTSCELEPLLGIKPCYDPTKAKIGSIPISVGEESSNPDEQEEGYQSFWVTEPATELDVYTPTNITGMFRRIIQRNLNNGRYSGTLILPARNTNQEKDHGDRFAVILRKNLGNSELGIQGNATPAGSMPIGIPSTEKGFSEYDSTNRVHFQKLEIEITVYAENLAEIELLGYEIHRIILAHSYNVLSKYTPGITYVSPPNMTEAMPSKKQVDRFELYIQFAVDFKDDTTLLIEKNMIEYTKINVSEDYSVNTFE